MSLPVVLRRSTRLSTSAQLHCDPPARKRRRLSVALAASASTHDADISPGCNHSRTTKATKATFKTVTKRTSVEPDPSEYTRVSNPWKFGAHVSAAGGVENAILNAAKIGANSFALFLKSQRKWASPALDERSIALFKSRMKMFAYEPHHILPHGSYLINLGNPDDEKRQKSYDCLLDDLRRCELLGLSLYNFHPGSTVGIATKEESISLIAECLNKAHKETSAVITVIENMAGAGNVIGSKFAEIASIIERIEDKSRIGVCLDTCHMFAAGYDIRTQEGYGLTRQFLSLPTMNLSEFDAQVGLQFLRAIHLNDSKMPLGSNRDRHENIGLGHLGLAPFALLSRDERLKDIPLVLETPISSGGTGKKEESPAVWRAEISVLNRLSMPDYAHFAPFPERHDEIRPKNLLKGGILTELLNEIEDVVGRTKPSGEGESILGPNGKPYRKGKEKKRARPKSDAEDEQEAAHAHD
ncbi:hypothetical protein M0805_001234 [Coniferiporia weirii]|nr:hypothetical protein M0805_001234 [Coniferiporia weirii]